MDLVFLGTNNVGLEIYEWLCDRESVTVHALLTTEGQLEHVERIEPDVVVAVGYEHVVPPDVLEIPDEGCINVHPGYLPHTRGFNPNVWSIVDDLPAGATMHYMDEGIDTGDIIARTEVATSFADTGRDVYERVESACFDLFTETWPRIERGEVDPTAQEDIEVTFHTKRDFENLCELDPEAEYTVEEFLDILRALTFPPFNNAEIDVGGERYFIDLSITPEADVDEDGRYGSISAY